jgi:hypothetical protein
MTGKATAQATIFITGIFEDIDSLSERLEFTKHILGTIARLRLDGRSCPEDIDVLLDCSFA